MSIHPTADAVLTSRWILVIVRDQHLRHLLLSALSLAGYAQLGCTILAEAEQVLFSVFSSSSLRVREGRGDWRGERASTPANALFRRWVKAPPQRPGSTR